MRRRSTTRCASGWASPIAPEDPAHRRALFGAINAALDTVQPVAVDFGALLAEQASATRLMMTVAQIIKHVDGSPPVRFLIAETETGYTLLAALWLARLFGIERHIEISPLFETAEALEQGATVLEEALRSPHYRAYLQTTGRLALQFGYSDSGRYVGQLAASYLIERLRLKIGQTLAAHGVTRRRGDPVRHAWREHRPRRASRLAGRPAEIPVADRVAPGAEPRRPAACARKARSRAATAICCSARRNWRWRRSPRIARADLSSGGRSDRGSGLRQPGFRRRLLRHRPRRHGGAGRGRRLCRAARRVRPGADRPHRIAPGGAADRTAWSAPRASAIRANCAPSRTTRSSSSSAGARTRCKGSAPRPRGIRRLFADMRAEQPALPSRDGSGDACAGAFRYRRAARGDRDARSRHLAGSRRRTPRAPGRREALVARGARAGAAGHLGGGAVDVPPHPGRSSGAARRPGRMRRAWRRARCCCTRCGWR